MSSSSGNIPSARLGPRPAGPPVRTGWDRSSDHEPIVTSLDDLSDVEAPAIEPPASPAVLVRGSDGIYRSVPLEQAAPPQRGTVVHYVETDPTSAPLGVRAGEYVTVIAGDRAGVVYLAQES